MNEAPTIDLAINKSMVGKPADHAAHEGRWTRQTIRPHELMQAITRQGYAFTCALKEDGARHRNNFASAQTVALDFDRCGIDDVAQHPLWEKASFAYESASSTPQKPRCRLVFTLDAPAAYETASAAIAALQAAFGVYKPDTSTKDPVRCWYGAQGKQARWIGGILDAGTVARLVAAVPKPEPMPTIATGATPSSRYAAKALEEEIAKVAAAATGSRNQTLFNVASNLFELVNTGTLDADTVRDQLRASAARTDLQPAEIERTIRSAESKTRGKQRMIQTLPTIVHSNGSTPEEPDWMQNVPPVWEEAPMPVSENVADATDRMLKASPEEEPEDRHPLDVAPATLPHLGWIDEYADFMSLQTASPLAFNRLCALVLAASVIRRKAVLRMAFGDVYANLYGAIIGASTVFHKTTALGKAKHLLWRANLESLLLPADFTPEGLLKGLSTQPHGLVVRDEIGRLFDSHNTKYMREAKPILTELYDGGTVKRQLSNQTITVTNPYLNILGATTPARFFDSTMPLDWQDGFLARWLFVLPEGEPDFDAEPAQFSTEADWRIGELATTLAAIDRQPETDFTIAPEAFTLWREWRMESTKAAYKHGDDTASAIVGRYSTYALKFALILAAVNDTWGSIDEPTMQSAVLLTDLFKGTAYRLLQDKQDYGVSGDKLQRIYKAILLSPPEEPISKRELQRRHIGGKSLPEALDMLLAQGAISQVPTGRTTGYIPTDRTLSVLPIKSWGKS